MEYVVRPGDTLAKIAARYGVTVQQLANANPDIENINQIFVGQRITIPVDEDEMERPERPTAPEQPVRRQILSLKIINNLMILAFTTRPSYRRGETVTLYLIKINIGNTSVRLNYPTTQRFDFRAVSGNQEWLWSDDRSFGFQTSELIIRPGECEVYKVNWDQEGNNNQQFTGNVRIEAWNVANELEDERLRFSINIQ